MNCPDFKTLMLMLDGELRGEEQKTVSEHLKSCSKCRKIIDSQKNLESTWRNSLKVPDSDKFRSMEQRIFNKTYHNRGWKTYIPAVAGIIAVLLGVKLILNNQPNPDRVTEFSRRNNIITRGLEMQDDGSLFSDTAESETASRSEIASGSFESQVSDASPETFHDTTAHGEFAVENLSQQPPPIEESEGPEELLAPGSSQLQGTDRRINTDEIAAGNSSSVGSGVGGFPGYSVPEESNESVTAVETVTGQILENTADEESAEEVNDTSLSPDDNISPYATVGNVQSMPLACDELGRAIEQPSESHSSLDEPLGENPAGGEVFVNLAFNAGGFPDSITALLLDSLVVDWIDYIPFAYRDTVLVVPLADVQNLLTGENAVPMETIK